MIPIPNLHTVSTTILPILFVIFVTYLIAHRRVPKGLQLPPGPPRRFLIGNLLDWPKHHEWETYMKWSKAYGDLVYLNIMGQSLLFVNSPKYVNELFEKKSAIYSERPDFPMISDLMGYDWMVTVMKYGDKWRRHRHLIHQTFNPTVVGRYKPIQQKYARALLTGLYETPENFYHLLRQNTGAIIIEATYGIKVAAKNDPYLEIAEIVMAAAGEAAIPGKYIVDAFPIFKYVPEWFPGAQFQRDAKKWRAYGVKMYSAPFDAVKEALKAGQAQPCIVTTLLEDLAAMPNAPLDQEEIIRNVAGSVYSAGADTTVSTLLCFILTMVLFPEAQQKAQQELDKVVGSQRLPDFDDKPNLPYVNALCKEILRWHTVVPTAAPHFLTQDDIIGNYFVPAGTVVLGNTWGLLHNEALYGADVHTFNPDRFLDPAVKDPNAAFGYGRRVCPGRHFAENSLFITIASVLHAFTISPETGGSPPDISAPDAFSIGGFSRPQPFKCSIVPRPESMEKLIPQEALLYNDESAL